MLPVGSSPSSLESSSAAQASAGSGISNSPTTITVGGLNVPGYPPMPAQYGQGVAGAGFNFDTSVSISWPLIAGGAVLVLWLLKR